MRTPQEKKILLQYVIGGEKFTVTYSLPSMTINFYGGRKCIGGIPTTRWEDAMGEMDLYRDKLASLIPGYLAEVKGKKNP